MKARNKMKKEIYTFQTEQPQYNMVHFWKVLEDGTILIKSNVDDINYTRWSKWGSFKTTCKDLLSAAKKLEASKK